MAEGLKSAWEEVRDELTAQSEDVARVRESYDTFLAESVKYANAMNMPLLKRR